MQDYKETEKVKGKGIQDTEKKKKESSDFWLFSVK